MLLSDWINVALCILSFLLAAISVITVVVTLRQNQLMIENATRPYVKIYVAVTSFHVTQFHLVLRNSGQSSALITDFSSSIDLSNLVFDEKLPVPFEHIVGHTLDPGQSLQSPINHFALIASDIPLSFHIRYSSSGKSYEETVTINVPSYCDHTNTHASDGSNFIQVISNTLEEIAVRQL